MKEKIYLILLLLFPVCLQSQNHFVQQGGNFVLEEGYLVLDNSQFTNNASFSGTNGTVKMSGTTADTNSSIGGISMTNFANLEINKSQNNVQLTQSASVSGQLTLAGGLLNLQAFDLNLLASATPIIGASAVQYIQTSATGQLKMQVGNTEVNFPVGNSAFNPIKIVNNGTIDQLGVNVEDKLLDGLTSGNMVDRGAVNRVWHVREATQGGSNLNINLQWNDGEELTGFDRTQSRFTSFEGNNWTIKNTGMAAGGSPYNFTGAGLTNLEAFTISSDVCQTSNVAILGVPPPSLGADQLDICGSTAMLSGSTPSGSTGSWSFSSAVPSTGASFSSLTDIATSLTGVFGGLYTLRWTVNSGVCAGTFDEMMVSFNPDEDIPGGDGVQDCVDICLGGDDAINSDGFGIPDDCDCAPNDEENEFVQFDSPDLQTFVNDVLLSGLDTAKRTVDFELSSTAEIEPKVTNSYPTVVFRAGNRIILEPGFHAKAGSDFVAQFIYCRNPITGQINPLQEESDKASEIKSKIEISENKAIINQLDMKVQPNIIQNEAVIIIDLPEEQFISLDLYNQHGQQIKSLLRKVLKVDGQHQFKLIVNQLSSGLYILQLKGTQELVSRKIIIGR